MHLPLGIKALKLRDWKWTNAHGNFTQTLQPDASFELSVSDESFKQHYPSFQERYRKTTENMQWLIRYALDHKLRLRAMGSGWSLSKVAVSEHGIINTKGLTMKAQLTHSQVSEAFLAAGGDAANLLFAQCGNEVIRINDLLEKQRVPPKSLRVSGGSNGQTIVGAFSTGTHGAAFKYGALCDCVLGMHLVVGPNRHVWLERASRPVTSAAFQQMLGAEVIRDDGLFNSALISFGSFGIIHSVLIEVEPLFLLEQHLSLVPYNKALLQAVTSGDFSGLGPLLKHPVEKLYHFELAINPYDFKKDGLSKEVYMRLMYKVPYQSQYPRFDPTAKGRYTYGDDVLGLIQTMLDAIDKLPGHHLERVLVPKLVNSLFKTAYDRPEKAMGTIGETFRNTVFRGRLFSAGFSFNRADIPQVIDLFLELNKHAPFTGVMAFRFVKGSPATLAFTRFADTCVLELDGAETALNHQFTEKFALALESRNLPYAIHWGKINNILNEQRVRYMHGDQNVDRWLHHRHQLLSDEVREIFNNEFLERCGLDQWLEVPV